MHFYFTYLAAMLVPFSLMLVSRALTGSQMLLSAHLCNPLSLNFPSLLPRSLNWNHLIVFQILLLSVLKWGCLIWEKYISFYKISENKTYLKSKNKVPFYKYKCEQTSSKPKQSLRFIYFHHAYGLLAFILCVQS